MAGLTGAGFDIKTRDAILSDMEGKQLAGISPSLDLQPTDPIGQINGIVADEAFALWQVGLALYDGMDPDEAVDDQLTGLALITGTVRAPSTKTQVIAVDVNVDTGTYPAGTMFASVQGTNNVSLFVNKSDVVNAGATTTIDADFEAVNAGPVQCLAGTLTVIAQPLSGWNSVTNPADGVIGSNIETDSALRIRREEELSAAGATTASAIKADVLIQMQPPTTTAVTASCTVLYNDSDATDSDGLPAHSVEVIARSVGATSGDDTLLATLILNQKAAGIGTYSGNGTYKDVTDSQENVERVYYTRPTDVPLTVVITVLIDSRFYPSNGDDLVKAALVLYANGPNGFDGEYQPGVDVYLNSLKSSVFVIPALPGSGVEGVVDVTAFTVNAGTSTIPISVREVATLSTGDITVNHA
jgi:hypothetical protein